MRGRYCCNWRSVVRGYGTVSSRASAASRGICTSRSSRVKSRDLHLQSAAPVISRGARGGGGGTPRGELPREASRTGVQLLRKDSTDFFGSASTLPCGRASLDRAPIGCCDRPTTQKNQARGTQRSHASDRDLAEGAFFRVSFLRVLRVKLPAEEASRGRSVRISGSPAPASAYPVTSRTSKSSTDNRSSVARIRLASCARLVALAIGAVTPGRCISHASATSAGCAP